MKKTEVKQLLIKEEHAGQRIDNFLHRYLNDVPRSRIYQMLRKGEVRVNKGRIKQTYKLLAGDILRIPPMFHQDEESGPAVSDSAKENILKSIIYEDDSLMVLNKPSGLSVHSGTGQPLGVIEIMRSIGKQFEKLELVHRLDRETSGCLLLAKNIPDLRRMHDEMKNGNIEKTYVALLAGKLSQNQYHIDKPLKKSSPGATERIVEIDEDGKNAITVFHREKLFAEATLVNIDLLTGRTHQIRVHSAHMDHPVIGDRKYGDREVNMQFRKLGLRRLFLHAKLLKLKSPATNKMISIEAPMGEELLNVIDRMT